MSRFNKTVVAETTTNLAGGEAYGQTPELELVSLMLTSFGGDTYYRKADKTAERLAELIDRVDPLFAAKAAVYTRKVHGLRSISHVAGSLVARKVSGKPWAVPFYGHLVQRPDDMLEMLAFHTGRGQKLSAAMKKGFAQAIGRFDGYQLAKYRGEGKEVSLVDVVNLVRPVPNERNSEALTALIKNELRNEATWEAMLTSAGQQGTTPAERTALKAKVWHTLLSEKRLGYMALLKNLRNILQQAPAALPLAIAQLTDPKSVERSKVLPFRYARAYSELMQEKGPDARQLVAALNKAADLSLANVPKLEGRTLVAMDVSGSMQDRGMHRLDERAVLPSQHAALFAAVFCKQLNADLMVFSDTGHIVQVDTGNSTLSLAASFKFAVGGTNFHSIFEAAQEPYDRVIILSDMQAWMENTQHICSKANGTSIPKASFNDYRRRTGADPTIYSFDLTGHGTMMFPERKVLGLAGFSDKVLGVMSELERDPHALVNAVKAVSFE